MICDEIFSILFSKIVKQFQENWNILEEYSLKKKKKPPSFWPNLHMFFFFFLVLP
jgi:hypothetical protein